MDAFVAWNLCLLETYFSPASSGDETWLPTVPEELDAIGAHLGGDIGFLEAVRSGPPWETFSYSGAGYAARMRGTPANLVERALGLVRQRRQSSGWRPAQYVDPGALALDYRGADAPTYLPFLAALVRSHGEQDERGYYHALQKALGLPPSWGSNQMAELEPVWEDLAKWCNETEGRFGTFQHRRLGGYNRIGVPRSQSVLSRRDAVMLTRVFAQAGATPGQRVAPQIVDQVRDIAAGSHFLSRPFREALRSGEFATLTADRITTLLEEWDGVVVGSSVVEQLADGVAAEPTADIGVALALGLDNALPWEVRWRVPGIRDAGVRLLRAGTDRWTIRYSGGLSVTTDASPVDGTARESARRLLGESAARAIEFREIAADEKSDSPEALRSGLRMILPARPLRTLVGEEVHDPVLGPTIHLVERDLPTQGRAYLLSAAANVENVRSFVRRNMLAAQESPGAGLPHGWVLFFLPDCSRLSDVSRDELPDGLPRGARSRPRAIRLIGGCQIIRAGTRQYLAYDLPQIELDAPPGTVLDAPGVDLIEEVSTGGPQPSWSIAAPSALRRFVVRARGTVPPATEIRAKHRGELVDRVQLRVAGSAGLRVAAGAPFALDAEGEAAEDAQGLRGVLLDGVGDTEATETDDEGVIASLLGESAHVDALSGPPPGIALLDALAQRGSMSYGAARDLVGRLLVSAGEREPNVSRVFRALSARGHIEIESDAKGRWTRVHCAPPCLYALGGRTSQGRVVAVLGGTPRLEHWHRLCRGELEGVSVFLEAEPSGAAPVLRVAAPTHDALHAAAQAWEIPFTSAPARRVALWSAGLARVRREVEQRGVESLGRMGRYAETLSNRHWEFVDRGKGVALSNQLRHTLFRFDDPETAGRHRLYAVGFWIDSSTPRYAFIADWRWGLWLAVSAFGEMVRARFGIEDACSWPFPYSRLHATLWLPRSLRLPAVPERVLVLCSGGLPKQHFLVARDHPEGLRAAYADASGEIGFVSPVYYDQLGGDAQRARRGVPWLAYRWVPESVARVIAERLGGCLQFVD